MYVHGAFVALLSHPYDGIRIYTRTRYDVHTHTNMMYDGSRVLHVSYIVLVLSVWSFMLCCVVLYISLPPLSLSLSLSVLYIYIYTHIHSMLHADIHVHACVAHTCRQDVWRKRALLAARFRPGARLVLCACTCIYLYIYRERERYASYDHAI